MLLRFSLSATPAASLLILLTLSCGKTPAPQPELKKEAAKPAPSMPRVGVTPAIQTKALTPKPGAKATLKQAAGTLSKPIGSGWWVAELDAGQCNVPAAGIYGCRFDADGTNKNCGAATVQPDEDDVVIVPLPGAAPDTTPGSTGSAATQPPVPPATTPAPGGSDPK